MSIEAGRAGIIMRPFADRGGTTLYGWKQIADYLNVSRATAQRWRLQGLPVVQPVHGGQVFAVPDDLDAWLTKEG